MIIGIVAISQNHAIGKDGKLPWHHSADLKFFKATTIGHTVVMGSTTWRSIGRALPGRHNVVLSRSGDLDTPAGVTVIGSKDEFIEFAKTSDDDIFIIGGAKVFSNLADLIEKWIVTEVPVNVADADTFMPHDFLLGFEMVDEVNLADNLITRVYSRK